MLDICAKIDNILSKGDNEMENLPNKFLIRLSKTTGLKTPNLCRYLAGGAVPRPDRANMLSYALRKEGVNIPPEDFVFNNKLIKKNILEQLKEVA
jgi:hypothetical protein